MSALPFPDAAAHPMVDHPARNDGLRTKPRISIGSEDVLQSLRPSAAWRLKRGDLPPGSTPQRRQRPSLFVFETKGSPSLLSNRRGRHEPTLLAWGKHFIREAGDGTGFSERQTTLRRHAIQVNLMVVSP